MSFSSLSSLSSLTEHESSFVSTTEDTRRRRHRTSHRSKSRSKSRTRHEHSSRKGKERERDKDRENTRHRHTSDSNARAHNSKDHKSHRRDDRSPARRTNGHTITTSDRRSTKHRDRRRSSRSRDRDRDRDTRSSRRSGRHSYPESSSTRLDSETISSLTEDYVLDFDLDPEPSSFSEVDLSGLPPGSGYAYVSEEEPKICRHCRTYKFKPSFTLDILKTIHRPLAVPNSWSHGRPPRSPTRSVLRLPRGIPSDTPRFHHHRRGCHISR